MTITTLPAEHAQGAADAAHRSRPDYVNAAYVAGWRYRNNVWVSPCGKFVEDTAHAACLIDGITA